MELLTNLQILSFITSELYILYDSFKQNQHYYQIELTKKENIKLTKEFYNISNKILLQILEELDINEPKLDLPYKEETIEKLIYSLNTNHNLTYFITKLINYIGIKNCNRLLLNIKDLTIVNEPGIRQHILNELGSYDPITNTITIHNKSSDTLSHEFLHMASTMIDDFYTYSGFCTTSDYEQFFCGFNEGYTEILNKRIFHANSIGYKANYTLCSLLEIMFDDKRELETAYFNNDLKVFINKFLEYGSLEELTDILNTLDEFATTPIYVKDLNDAIKKIYTIIQRKNELDKIQKCKEIIENQKPKIKPFIKRLVKKIN